MSNGLLQVEDLRLHYRTTTGVVQVPSLRHGSRRPGPEKSSHQTPEP